MDRRLSYWMFPSTNHELRAGVNWLVFDCSTESARARSLTSSLGLWLASRPAPPNRPAAGSRQTETPFPVAGGASGLAHPASDRLLGVGEAVRADRARPQASHEKRPAAARRQLKPQGLDGGGIDLFQRHAGFCCHLPAGLEFRRGLDHHTIEPP